LHLGVNNQSLSSSASRHSGASKPARIEEDTLALAQSIPTDFWRELREQYLVAATAPLPGL
jgi:hypothetical protein